MIRFLDKKIISYFLITLFIFALDRISKIYVINIAETYGQVDIYLNKFLNIILVWNSGIGFGLLSFEKQFLYNFITLIIILVNLLILYLGIKSNNFKTILEIGTWNGLGSTKTIIESIKKTNLKVDFYSIETDRIAYRNAKKNLKNDIKYVNLMYGKIVEVKELPLVQDIDFNSFGFDPKNVEWYIQDLRRYRKVKNIITKLPDQFDFILFDGGEFSTFAEFNKFMVPLTFVSK